MSNFCMNVACQQSLHPAQSQEIHKVDIHTSCASSSKICTIDQSKSRDASKQWQNAPVDPTSNLVKRTVNERDEYIEIQLTEFSLCK